MVGLKVDFHLQLTLMASSLYQAHGPADWKSVRAHAAEDHLP